MKTRLLCLLTLLVAAVPASAQFADADMEAAGNEAWSAYGTPLTVEKTPQARSGRQALRVVTDNKQTMGGNYEGTSHSLGELGQGDTVRLSFWYRATEGRGIIVGIGRGQMTGRWEIGGSGWQPVALEYRVRQPGHHTIWISQADTATEFFLDDFSLKITPRPEPPPPSPGSQMSAVGPYLRVDQTTGRLDLGEKMAGPQQSWLSLTLLGSDGTSYENVPFTALKLLSLDRRGPQSVECRFAMRDEAIEVRVLITAEGSAASFRATVTNNSRRTILGLTLPDLYGLSPDGPPENWTLVHPWVCGRIVKDPLKSEGVDTGYPGRGVMGWMDLSGEQRGLYLGVHDGSGQGVRLQAIPAPQSRMDLSTGFELCLRPGQSWQSPPVVLALHEGDWHAGADRYRAWADRALRKPNLPQWMRDSNGWTLVGLQNGIPFRYVADLYRTSAWMGLEYLHLQGQQIDFAWFDAEGKRHGHEVTFAYPSPRLGTPEELRRQIAEIHADEGHVMFYILPDRYTPSHATAEDFGTGRRSDIPPDVKIPDQKWFLDNALVTSPGAGAPEENAFMQIRFMCPGSKQWREWLRWWAIEYYAKKLGADGMYWDVTGRTGPFRCFNTRHDHQGDNNWGAGCLDLMKTVMEQGRKINPDYQAAIEGCSDVLGQYVGYHLLSGATEDQRVFRYTFPATLCVDGFANHYRPWTMPQKAHRVFLEGERFDVYGYHQYVKRVINLRRRIKPFIDWPAVYRDDQGLEISDPKVQARRFERTDAGNRVVTVTMLNEDRVAGSRIMVRGLTPVTINLFHLDGRIEPVPLPRAANVAVIPVPAEDVSAAVIVQQVAPALQVVPFLEPLTTPGDNGLLLSLFMPLQRTASSFEAGWPAGFSPEAQELPQQNPCLRSLKFVDPRNLQGLDRWRKVKVEVKWPGGKQTAWTMLAPPLVNGDCERLDGEYIDFWNAEPDATNPGEGKYSLVLSARNTAHGHVTVLAPVKPGCRYRFSAMIRRASPQTPASAQVVEYTNERDFVRSAALMPTKAGQWERLSTEFTTQDSPRSTAVYLYNASKTENAWFDDLQLEEVR